MALMLWLVAAAWALPMTPPVWKDCPESVKIEGTEVRLVADLWVNRMPGVDSSPKVHGRIRVEPTSSGYSVSQVWLSRGELSWSGRVEGESLVDPPAWAESEQPVQIRAQLNVEGKPAYLRASAVLGTVW